MSERFYMVYGVDCGAPTVRHCDLATATAEAKRLARNNPGVEFIVLAAVRRVIKNDVLVEDIGGAADDGIPF